MRLSGREAFALWLHSHCDKTEAPESPNILFKLPFLPWLLKEKRPFLFLICIVSALTASMGLQASMTFFSAKYWKDHQFLRDPDAAWK